MQRRMTISFISLLALGFISASAADVDTAPFGAGHQDDAAIRNAVSQRGMFDGVKLTEIQRQHMRDLMHQARQEVPVLHPDDIEKMHALVTAEQFDEAAVRKQIMQMMQAQIDWQTAMARVRNQMYNLLTSDQKNILEQRHQQRMAEMELPVSQTPSPRLLPKGAEQ